jgi:hypothetical protein
VRAFTPDVESALRWFHWTHTLVIVPLVGPMYQRQSWPAEGGAGDQDAWLTAALTQLCDVHNDILAERGAMTRKKKTTKPGSN